MGVTCALVACESKRAIMIIVAIAFAFLKTLKSASICAGVDHTLKTCRGESALIAADAEEVKIGQIFALACV